jgi:UDP-N-acetylglucosamine acyltransferase
MSIHPTAIIAADAKIGDNVSIGAYSVVGSKVDIGAGTIVGPHVVINGPTKIGNDNRIFQFASIGDAPQDKKYNGEPTELIIGDRNVFRECCTINRGTVTGHGVTRIGSDNLFMAYSHVAHDCIVGNKCILANNAGLAGHVEVDDWVILSAYSGVHQFCKVGAHAFLGNNAAATRDVPPYVMAVGSPAEPHSVNSEGLKRRGFNPDQIRNIRNAYRVLYRSQLKLEEAIAQLTELAKTQPELQLFIDFMPRSQRSLIR